MTESRRRFLLKTAGSISFAGTGGYLLRSQTGNSTSGGHKQSDGPDGPDGDWILRLDEQWNEFDTSRWSVGFIDHSTVVPDDDATVSEEHVIVDGDRCRLQIESQGTGPDGCYQGALNSSTRGLEWHPSEGVPVNPVEGGGGQYIEARIKMPGRTGILPAFWAMPANTNWPPEIDVAELFQRGSNPEAERRTLHTDAHWTTSTNPGDQSTHRHDKRSTEMGIDLPTTFNTYGCAWFEDRLEWYFNGSRIRTREWPPELFATLTHEGALPFGLLFSNHVNRVGTVNLHEAWTEEMVIDWVRVWDKPRPTSE